MDGDVQGRGEVEQFLQARSGGTGAPAGASSAAASAVPRSRLMSSDAACSWTPTRISPFSRTSAGTPPGSTLASVTSRPSAAVSGAVAAGTSSRSATQSGSPGRPRNGLTTCGA
jgi:hypothetical protein